MGANSNRGGPSLGLKEWGEGIVTEMRRRKLSEHCFLAGGARPAWGILAMREPGGYILGPLSPLLPLVCYWGCPVADTSRKPEGRSADVVHTSCLQGQRAGCRRVESASLSSTHAVLQLAFSLCNNFSLLYCHLKYDPIVFNCIGLPWIIYLVSYQKPFRLYQVVFYYWQWPNGHFCRLIFV